MIYNASEMTTFSRRAFLAAAAAAPAAVRLSAAPSKLPVGTRDAMLKPLGNYGGPTQTILPRPNSPAVNAIPTGTTTTVGTALCPAPGTIDQRGINANSPQGAISARSNANPKE